MQTTAPDPLRALPPRPAPAPAPPAPVITSRDLLAGRSEIVILHGEAEYRLRLTPNGRLLLTK